MNATRKLEQLGPAHKEIAEAVAQALRDGLSPQDGIAWTGNLVDHDGAALDETSLTASLAVRGGLEGTLYLSVSLTAAPELRAALPGEAADTPEAAWLRLVTLVSKASTLR